MRSSIRSYGVGGPGIGLLWKSGRGQAGEVLETTEHIVSSFAQSSVYAGLAAASVSNMSDGNGNGDAVTGTATNAVGTQWIRADLGSAKPVSKIRLGGGDLPGFATIFPEYAISGDFLIQYSNDASTWTTSNNTIVTTFTNAANANRDVDIYLPPTIARYWRITRGADIATATFRVFGYNVPVAPATVTYTQSSVYAGLSAGSAANLNETPHDAATGTATDAAAGEWIKADLGSSKIVGAVMLGSGTNLTGWGAVSTYLNGCTLEYSDDNTNWTLALNVEEVTDNLPSVWPRELPLISARYWRVFRAAAGGYVALTAFRLYTAVD